MLRTRPIFTSYEIGLARKAGISEKKITLAQQPWLRPGAKQLDIPYMLAIEDAVHDILDTMYPGCKARPWARWVYS